jgi:hypothetical protein
VPSFNELTTLFLYVELSVSLLVKDQATLVLPAVGTLSINVTDVPAVAVPL